MRGQRPKICVARVDNTAQLYDLFAGSLEFQELHARVTPFLQVPTSLSGLNDILSTLQSLLPRVHHASAFKNPAASASPVAPDARNGSEDPNDVVLRQILPDDDANDDPQVKREVAAIVEWVDLLACSDRSRPLWHLKVVAGYDVAADERQRVPGDAEPPRKPYFYGIHDTNPVWCSLFFRSSTKAPDADWAERHYAYCRLQAWYLGAFIRLQARRQAAIRGRHARSG